MKRLFITICLALSIGLISCESYRMEPEDSTAVITYRGAEQQGTGGDNANGGNHTGGYTSSQPSVPYTIHYDESGVCKITAYIGLRWDSYSFWPRNDNQYGNRLTSVLQFPSSGGDVIFEIVNMYTYFSLYITNYNKYEAAAVYYFDEEHGYPGVLSFGQYGTDYDRIYYRLVVKENLSTSPVPSFCQAHWASNYARAALSEFNIQCRQLAAGDYSSNKIILIDY